jgi:hypothetical protein
MVSGTETTQTSTSLLLQLCCAHVVRPLSAPNTTTNNNQKHTTLSHKMENESKDDDSVSSEDSAEIAARLESNFGLPNVGLNNTSTSNADDNQQQESRTLYSSST